jgi:uncharacterized membrane protein
MMSRLKHSWQVIRASLWLLPALMTLGACLLAVLTIWIDRNNVINIERSWFMLTVGTEGARGVLSTVAGSIITVTGVVFSITIVVLQLASSQYSPRVLRSFTEDRIVQLVLGVFIGTFTYALMVLRTVRSEFQDYERFVPSFSVNVAVLLALASIGFLIYFIYHIAEAILAENIIARVSENALLLVDELFPQHIGQPGAAPALEFVPDHYPCRWQVTAEKGGYLQRVDEAAIMALAEQHDVVFELGLQIGAFVVRGDVVMTVYAETKAELQDDDVRGLLKLGAERTRHQDIERALIELTDMAVRALSPGVNDPTTAITCVDRLTEILSALVERQPPPLVRADDHGAVRVIARRPEFPGLLALSFGQILQHGQHDPRVVATVEHALARIAARAPADRHHAVRDFARQKTLRLQL